MRMHKAVFLDRDGVINVPPEEGDYVRRVEDMRLLDGAAEAIRMFNDAGFKVAVITNQRGVALGHYDLDELRRIHERMIGLLADGGARIDALKFCPHDRNDGCECRKPLPGMILEAARELDIDLKSSLMIGDRPSDVRAGRAAGLETVLIGGRACAEADGHYVDLLAAARQIVKR